MAYAVYRINRFVDDINPLTISKAETTNNLVSQDFLQVVGQEQT